MSGGPTAGADMLSWHDVTGPHKGRQVGRVVRVYKASCGKTIGIDDLALIEDVQKISMTRFHHSYSRRVRRRLLHHTGVSRTISTITVIGDHTSLSEDMNTATWDKPENENDVVLDMSDLPQVGDSI